MSIWPKVLSLTLDIFWQIVLSVGRTTIPLFIPALSICSRADKVTTMVVTLKKDQDWTQVLVTVNGIQVKIVVHQGQGKKRNCIRFRVDIHLGGASPVTQKHNLPPKISLYMWTTAAWCTMFLIYYCQRFSYRFCCCLFSDHSQNESFKDFQRSPGHPHGLWDHARVICIKGQRCFSCGELQG